MTYEEVQEILNTKKNIPYPKLMNVRQNIKYADLLYDNFSGTNGELTTVLQYTYEKLEIRYYEGLSKIINSIVEEEIKHMELIGDLIKQLGKGVTVLEGRGGYTGDRKKVIMCAIPTKQYFLAKEGILNIDKDAIILINDVYQSSGLE